jgi:hypothetical protein
MLVTTPLSRRHYATPPGRHTFHFAADGRHSLAFASPAMSHYYHSLRRREPLRTIFFQLRASLISFAAARSRTSSFFRLSYAFIFFISFQSLLSSPHIFTPHQHTSSHVISHL